MAEDFDFEHSYPKEVYQNDEGIGLSGEHKAWLESNFHEFVNKRKYRFRGKFNLNILDLENEIRRWNNAYWVVHLSCKY